MKIIAISQHKGGVGKTTTSINISAALVQRGYKVLLIDLDAQANLTESVGITAGVTIAEALAGKCKLPVQQVKIQTVTTLDVVPSSLDLAGAEAGLHLKMLGRELVLKGLLADVQQYDFVIIDCPPSLGLLTINALAAADDIIIPVQAEYLAVRGLNSLMDIIGLVRSTLNNKLKILGVVVTQYDGRKVLNRDTSEALTEMFGAEMFTTRIRENIALAEAPTAHQDIFTYAPDSNGAADYNNLTAEILNRYKLPAIKKEYGKAQTI